MGASGAGHTRAPAKAVVGTCGARTVVTTDSGNAGRNQRPKAMSKAISTTFNSFQSDSQAAHEWGGLPAMGIPYSMFHRVDLACASFGEAATGKEGSAPCSAGTGIDLFTGGGLGGCLE